MSHKLMEQMVTLSAHGMTEGDRLVLLWLAYRANDNGQAWPAQADIAGATGLGHRAVRRSLKRLIAAGHIQKESHKQRGVVLYGVTLSGRLTQPYVGSGEPTPAQVSLPTRLTQTARAAQVVRQVGSGEPTKTEDREDTLRARPQEPPMTAAPLEGAAPRAQTAQPEKRITCASETPEQRKARAEAFAAILARSRGETVSA